MLLLLAELAPGVAHADTPEQIEAKQRFSRGVEAFSKGKYDAAIEEFKASYRLRAVPVVLFNLAESYTALDAFDEAMTYVGLYTVSAPTESLDAGQREQLSQLRERIRRASGTIRIVDAPEGASVLIDGRDASAAMVRPVYVAAGTHVVSVTHADFAPFRKSLKVDVGEAEVLKPELLARPRDATVRVVSTPGDATVLIDGRAPAQAQRKGGTTIAAVRPGWHEISVRKPGMTAVDAVFEVRAGETRELSAGLLPSPPPTILRSPWFWAGVGLVAGGVVGYTVAKTQ